MHATKYLSVLDCKLYICWYKLWYYTVKSSCQFIPLFNRDISYIVVMS